MQAWRPLIAIVDDDEPVRRALGRLLRASGYAVVASASGHELLDYLARNRPDCALLDLHLTGLSALDVLSRLLAMEPCVPVVVITGHDAPGVEERVLAAGARRYLLKPLDDSVLLGAVAAAIDSRCTKV